MHAARRLRLKKANSLLALVEEALKEPMKESCLICMRFKPFDDWATVGCKRYFEWQTSVSAVARNPQDFAKECSEKAALCDYYNPEDLLSIKCFSRGVKVR